MNPWAYRAAGNPRALTGTALLVLLALTAWLYWPGLNGPFLLDDLPNLEASRVGPPSLSAALDAATRNPSGVTGRPVSNLSFLVEYWIHGLETPWPSKFVNLMLHLACGMLVFLLATQVLALLAPSLGRARQLQAALLCTAAWLLHPIQVSTTLYVVQRMAQLSALFSLAAISCFAFAWTRHTQAGKALGGLLGFFVLTLAATLSKENGALTPLLAASLIAAAQWRPATWSTAQKALVIAAIVVPILLGLAVFLSVPELFLRSYANRPWTLPQRAASELVYLAFYLKLFVLPLPWDMGLFHDGARAYSPLQWQPITAAAGWVIAAVLALWLRPRSTLPLFALLWYLSSHAVESSILPLELVFEHRNYTALFGPCLLLAGAFVAWPGRSPRAALAAATGAVLLLGGMTALRVDDWSHEQKFYAAEYRNHPESLRALQGEIARLRKLGAPHPVVAPLEDRLIERRSTRIWPYLVLARRQCRDADADAPWDEISRRIEKGDSLAGFADQSGMLVDEVLSGACPSLDKGALAKVLEKSYQRSIATGSRRSAEKYASYIGWLLMDRHQPDEAIAWFWLAAGARPDAYQPLFNIAYFHLNNGQPAEAEKALAALQQRLPAITDHVAHRVAELELFVEQALNVDRSAGGHEHPTARDP